MTYFFKILNSINKYLDITDIKYNKSYEYNKYIYKY